jgi:hypothetical protein
LSQTIREVHHEIVSFRLIFNFPDILGKPFA